MLQSIFIGLVVALVGYLLQQRSWRHNKREEIRQREFDACMSIVESLAKAIDARLTATEKYLSEVNQSRVSDETLGDYKKSVLSWMHDFSSRKSKIFHYFGRDKMMKFEYTVHDSLREVSDIISRTNRYGLENLSRADRKEHKTCGDKLRAARYKSYRFLADLNDMTSKEQTGRIRLYDNISAGHIDMISRVYLIQRLLGIKS